MRRIVAFDFETYAFRPGLQLPPAVCMSWAEVIYAPHLRGGYALGAAQVVKAREGIELIRGWLTSDTHIIGAETAFDSLVSVATLGQEGRPLLKLWTAAYEANRVTDVFVRQKLLDLAAGCYRWELRTDGKWDNHGYALDDLAWRHCRRKLDKENPWRLRFGELDGVEIADYPPEAREYSLLDAVATAEVWIAQETSTRGGRADPRIARNFPGFDPLRDEYNQARACVPLKAMSAYGLRTDAEAVEFLAEEVIREHTRIRDFLVGEGLVRRELSRSTKGLVAYITRHGLLAHFVDGPKISLTAARLMATGDPWLALVPRWRELDDISTDTIKKLTALRDGATTPGERNAAEKAIEAQLSRGAGALRGLIERGIIEESFTRDTKAAALLMFRVCREQGRPVPRTDSYSPETHGPESLQCVALDSDACTITGDPLLIAYAELTSLSKTLSNDIPALRSGAVYPIHTRFETILETGRTSSSKPNVQNVRRLPGIRECFRPRPGNIYVESDFSMLELHTLAQTCLWVLGYSTLAEALRSGKDPHSMIACAILSIDYAEAMRRKEAGDSEFDNARTAGKGVNFGRAGGLGAKTFVVYAWTNYKIRLTLEKAQELIDLYNATWREMPDYFRWISSLETYMKSGSFNVVQPWSGRLRAGASYCAACNSPFQGLGSDVAKRALWLVFKACYVDETDPMFDARPVLFVHDSIMTECAESRCDVVARRQQELMDQAGREILPDVPVRADTHAMRQWSKKAKKKKDASGKLVPWDLFEACSEAGAKYVRDGNDPAGVDAFLLKKDWPRYAVQKCRQRGLLAAA
jgi:hypothetical protein